MDATIEAREKAAFYGLEVVDFEVIGLSSLLQNNPLSMQRPQEGMNIKKIPSPEEEARSKLYLTEEGTVYMPSIAFRSAILNGAKGRRIGKKGATSVLQGAVFTSASRAPLFNPDTHELLTTEDYRINTVRAVVQRQGVLRSRPEFERWGAMVSLAIDTDYVDPRLVEDALNTAGRIVGVGDWRPEKKGSHGRFVGSLAREGVEDV